jgi:hypothetical protein
MKEPKIKILYGRLSEPLSSFRYLTDEEMKLRKSDFPDDAVFMLGPKRTSRKNHLKKSTTRRRKSWQ